MEAHTTTLAGMTMTGTQWQSLSNDLKEDGALRDWLVEQMMRDGKTREEAERKTDEMADVYGAMAKPPSQRSNEEREAIKRAESDPEFRRYTKMAVDRKQELSAAADQRQSADADRAASVDDGSDLVASAPDLSAHHRVAVAATPPVASPLPPPVPQAPQSSPGMAGLDV